MREPIENSNDPLFLFSKSLDEELNPAEKAQLEQVLRTNPGFAREADQLRSLERLLIRWAADAPSLDWANHLALVEAQTKRTTDDLELNAVDRLLERWASAEISVDESAFTTSVMQRVRLEPKAKARTLRYPLVFRVGLPLAAAAAIAFAVFTGAWTTEGTTTVSFGKRPTPVAFIGGSETVMATVAVSFDRSRPTKDASPFRVEEIAIGAVGVDSWTPTTEDQVPM